MYLYKVANIVFFLLTSRMVAKYLMHSTQKRLQIYILQPFIRFYQFKKIISVHDLSKEVQCLVPVL